MRISLTTGLMAFVVGTGSIRARPSDLWADAERSAKDLIYYREDFTKLNKRETQAIVTAIANAEEAERKEISERAAREAADKVKDDFSKAERRKDEALQLLDRVLKDTTFRQYHRDAEELKSKVIDTWASIERMSTSVRGANHPVVAYMIEKGKELHETRQRGCPVYEFDTGNGFADCIRTSCDIIEFKPDNDRAKRAGEAQLKKYKLGLQDPAIRKNLDSKNSDFAKCTDFRLTIEAYTLIPEIGDDGSFREVSASWSTYTY
jgi:hypothetical protein